MLPRGAWTNDKALYGVTSDSHDFLCLQTCPNDGGLADNIFHRISELYKAVGIAIDLRGSGVGEKGDGRPRGGVGVVIQSYFVNNKCFIVW